jgi:hypothetical protein
MTNAWSIAASIPWFGWVGIVAIISGSVTGIVNACLRHFERMELIRQGMNPDAFDAKPRVPEL